MIVLVKVTDQPERVRDNETPTTNGKVIAIDKDGKSFSIEVQPQARGEAPGKLEIKITDNTTVTYYSVPENGAKPTEGYQARIRLQNGSKDMAETVAFAGAETGRRSADFMGEVAGSSKDSITLIAAGPRGERGVEPKKQTIPLDSKTVIVFSNVAGGQAKITDGYRAAVVLADDGKTAAKVQLTGMAGDVGRRDREEKRPDLNGKVAVVAPNARQITVESLAGGRGEEPTRKEITIGDKTSVVYNNVQADGTKPTEGYHVQIWFAEGSKDTAAKVVFSGNVPERWISLSGKVIEVAAIGKEGMTIEIEQPAQARGDEPKRTKIKIPATAKVSYSGVGPNEAKPTVGFDVQIRLKDDSNDTATQVTFQKPGPGQERGRRER